MDLVLQVHVLLLAQEEINIQVQEHQVAQQQETDIMQQDVMLQEINVQEEVSVLLVTTALAEYQQRVLL